MQSTNWKEKVYQFPIQLWLSFHLHHGEGSEHAICCGLFCFFGVFFFNEWGKLKGYPLTGSGCSAWETSLELVQNPWAAVLLYRSAPIALSFLPTQILSECHLYCGTYCLWKHFISFWLIWCRECHQFISSLIMSNNHKFAQVPAAIRLLLLEQLLGLTYSGGYISNSLILGSSQRAPKFLWKFTDKFANPSVTLFYVFVSNSAYPCYCWGWNLCQTSQVSAFPSLYHPSQKMLSHGNTMQSIHLVNKEQSS